MYTIVYLTINLVNFKFYVGIHTYESDEYDFYLGDGCYANDSTTYMRRKNPLAFAIRTYGVKNFRRITIAKFDNKEDAARLRDMFVNEGIIKLNNCYNVLAHPIKNEDNAPKDKFTIYQYSKEGQFIQEFATVKDAAKALDLDVNLVINSLLRRSCPSGYYFLQSDEQFNRVKGKSRNDYIYYVYNPDGTLYRKFTSVSEGLSAFPKAKSNGIRKAIFKERKYQKMFWSLNEYANFFKKKQPYPVDQFDLKGNYIKTYDSISKCKKEFPDCLDVINGIIDNIEGYIFKLKS